MAYPSNLTLGGSGPPRILVCGNNLISLSSSGFEEDTGDWASYNGGIISRYAAGSTTFYGKYVLVIEDNSILEGAGAELIVDFGKSVAGLTVVVTWYDFAAIVGHTYTLELKEYAVNESHKEDYVASITQVRRCLEYNWKDPAAGSTFSVIMYACEEGYDSRTGYIFIDELEVREVEYTWNAVYEPHIKPYGWEKILQASHELIDGSEKEYLLGYRFYTEWGFEYLDLADETMRVHMANGSHLIVFPHNEKDYNVDAKWNGEYNRDYFGQVYAGHVGGMSLRGVKLEKEIPYSY